MIIRLLKYPTNKNTSREEQYALNFWRETNRFPKIIETDEKSEAFLMTYIENNNQKASVNEVISLFNEMHKNNNALKYNNIKSLKENVDNRIYWAEHRFIQKGQRGHLKKLKREIITINKLLETNQKRSLLHGDFQDKNILYYKNKAYCLDPLPCLGEPLFDLALWASIRDPYNQDLANEITKRTKIDKERFLKWFFALSLIEDRK